MNYQRVPPEGVTGNAIEDLAATIQRLPADIRWLHAVPDVIQSKACGLPLKLGPRRRFAAAFLAVAVALRVARLVTCAGSVILLRNAYRSQVRTKSSASLGSVVFVGIGALRERALIEALSAERSSQVSFLNETSLGSFSVMQQVGWGDLWREWQAVARVAWKQLGGEEPSVGLPQFNRLIEFLTQAHRYAYLRAWFRQMRAKSQVQEPVVFSAASVVAFAAVSVGVKCAYHLHGFQRRSLVYPEFEEVRCFTDIEAAHIARRLPNARVIVEDEPARPIETKKVVAIAGGYGQSLGLDDCASFIAAARDNDVPVVIRQHPLDKSDFFERWRSDDRVTFCDTSASFDVFLEHYRPRMLLSWFSTALFDALRRGVVPVTVETEAWRPLDTVFPFQEISLRWPRQRAGMFALLSNEAERETFLADRRAIAGLRTSK